MGSVSANRFLARGLILSAEEIKQLTGWPEAMIQDYLNILDNLTTLASTVDEKNDILKKVSIITASMSPYETTDTDEELFLDTTDGDIQVNLRPGEVGRNYRLINVGQTGNQVNITPYGTELLFGENTSEYLINSEVLILTFSSGLGWY